MSFEATEVVIEVHTFLGMCIKNRAWATTKNGRQVDLQFDKEGIVFWIPRPHPGDGFVCTVKTERTGNDTHVTRKRFGARP